MNMKKQGNASENQNMDRNPLVSVIMGTYEPDLYELSAAVRSIRMQTLTAWELLICDDGSSEDTYRSIRKLAASDARIRVARNRKNMGLAHALNRCIPHARGDFIARMDADDISRPERLEIQVKFLRENPEYMWVASSAELFEKNRIWGSALRPERPDARAFLHSSPYIHPSVMFRREVFFPSVGPDSASSASLSGLPGSPQRAGKRTRESSLLRHYHVSPLTARCEDYELFMRLHSEGLRGYNLERPLLLYRENERTMHRPFKSCLSEMLIRIRGFRQLGILSLKTFPYVVKPVLVGIASLFPDIAQRIRTGRRNGWDRRNPDRGQGSSNTETADRERILQDVFAPEDAAYRERTLRNVFAPEDAANRERVLRDVFAPGDAANRERILRDVFAPLIVSFTVWVLREAEAKGIKRLYFLSRDGYLPYRTAVKLVKSYNVDIECRYLYCSRYSLRVPMYSENVAEALDHVTRGGIDVTFRKILRRSGFRAEDMEKMQDEFPGIDPDQVIPYSELSKVRRRLAENDAYIDLLVARSRAAWDPLRAYFAQEGLLEEVGICEEEKGSAKRTRAEDTCRECGNSDQTDLKKDIPLRTGIVDSGWTGTTQKSIDEIRRRCGIETPVEGFYFGLFEIPKGMDPGTYHSFYFGPKTKLLNKVFFSNSLFEAMVRANHGTVSGYRTVKTAEKGDEEAHSISEPIPAPFRKNDIAEKIDLYIDQYLDQLAEREKCICPEPVTRSVPEKGIEDRNPGPGQIPAGYDSILTPEITRQLRKFMWNPDPEEAEYFGSLPFSDDLLDETEREVGPVFPAEYLKENRFANRLFTSLGIRKKAIHESAWFEATCVRSAGRANCSERISCTDRELSSAPDGSVKQAGILARCASARNRMSFSFYKTVSYLRKGLFSRSGESR